MNKAGLFGFLLLPLAFAALPLLAIVVSANAGSSPVGPRVEVVSPDTPATDSGFDVTTLGFSEDDHLASDCGFTDSYGVLYSTES